MNKREFINNTTRTAGLIFFLAISIIMNGQTIDPPQLTCISVLNNTSIQLDWKLPENVNSNYSFILYNWTGSGYQKLDSLPYNQTSYVQNSLLPSIGNYSYYIKSCSLTTNKGNIYSINSDTLNNILLLDYNEVAGIVNIAWNSPCNRLINGSGGWYHIYRKYSSGDWIIRDSVPIDNPVLSINDTIDICDDSINYKIVLPNSYGCSSVSNVRGKFLYDETVPHQPMIDYVTVDSDIGHNVIHWQPDQSTDTKGYYIYKYLNPTGIKIDSVIGRFNNTYIHQGSNPESGNETYYIIAYDSCNLASVGSNIHNTIFLSITPDRCAYTIKLSWNPYINMESGIMGYVVYKKTGSGQFDSITTVSSNTTFYNDEDIIANGDYTYYIKAIDNSGTRFSKSNIQSLTFSYPRKPEFNYLRSVNVTGNNQIEVKVYVDTTAYISEYHLYRIENNNTDTLLIQNLFHLSNQDISFIDKAVNTDEKSYQYILKLRDICNDENLLTSNKGISILVKAYMQNGMKNYLKWNKYESWAGNVSHYDVYRKTEKGWDVFPVATVPSNGMDTLSYTDDISNFGDTNGQFAYYIKAIEGNNNPYGFVDTSCSNIAYVNQYPKLFVPNAFVPDGYNSKFLPIMGFVHPEDYLLKIYNRWGELVFETTDKNQGWDGQFKNNDAPQGVYVYLIKIKNSSNEIIEKRGTVTLIR